MTTVQDKSLDSNEQVDSLSSLRMTGSTVQLAVKNYQQN